MEQESNQHLQADDLLQMSGRHLILYAIADSTESLETLKEIEEHCCECVVRVGRRHLATVTGLYLYEFV